MKAEPHQDSASTHEVTELLNQWGLGDRAAFDQLLPMVYRELHRIAKRCLNQHQGHETMQATAVVHEAYLKLAGGSAPNFENRGHFFNVAAKVMRHVLLDYARGRRAAKRGGEMRMLSIEEGLAVAGDAGPDIVAMDEALTVLAVSYPRQAEVVELRCYCGLSLEETAQALKLSAKTVTRDWRFAKSFLKREMERGSRA